MDYFKHKAKMAAVRDAESAGLVSDSMDVRLALIARMRAGELTLDECKAELSRIQKASRLEGKVTRAHVYRTGGHTPPADLAAKIGGE